MGKVINLGRARKQRQRADARSKADGNAARFGRSKAERARAAAERSKQDAALSGARLTGGAEIVVMPTRFAAGSDPSDDAE